jgi:hypothetical protein
VLFFSLLLECIISKRVMLWAFSSRGATGIEFDLPLSKKYIE